MKKLKKEELENMSYKDITNIILENSKEGLNTLDLFTKIIELLELPKSTIDNKIADYYTSLTTDKRFVLIDGKWDLRNRYPSDKVIVKLEEDEEEVEEEKEDDLTSEEDEEEDFDSEDDIDDSFEDDDDDDLADLVVLDEDELEQEQ